MLSSRGARNAATYDIPWRYAVAPTYNKDTNPNGIISFGLAEHGPVQHLITEYINQNVQFTTDSICYSSTASSHPLQPALARHINTHFSPLYPVTPEMVIKCNGCSAAGSMLSFALAEPGDGVLVSRPVYGRFELDYGIEGGVEIVYADTEPGECFETRCVQRYEKALVEADRRGVRIRALVLVNPHNPIGRCYPTETLIEIMKFCNRHKIHLIADEIYALCIFDPGNGDEGERVPFRSVLSLATPDVIDLDLVHVLYGFSKDFSSGGLHLGFTISYNAELRRACSSMLRFHSPSGTAEQIGTAILQDQYFLTSFIEKSNRDLEFSYKLATSVLDEAGIEYVKGGNAGFFLYMDLSPYLAPATTTNKKKTLSGPDREFALAQRFLDNGLFLHPGEEHCKHLGWFRLVFSHEEGVLREGLDRLVKTVRELKTIGYVDVRIEIWRGAE
ncbi:pyridoxal phosphate-dependent transferase [Aspergillus stella-maris]|uniref:pyridoxal phosphate-dependent transferase n=1 Tax=Aspergillus stella-maris TaxID=1810926 RepID=UPI003CCDE90F